MARDHSYFIFSQPSSSQSSRVNEDEDETVERAFWQSTPTALEQLREEADDELCHRAPTPVHDHDQDEPEDPLRLSREQSRLMRRTWTTFSSQPTGSVPNDDPDGETRRTTSRSRGRHLRGDHGGSGSGAGAGAGPTDPSCGLPDRYATFGCLKNIEKVCETVDERMRKRKVQKEWSIRMISETARLRGSDEEPDPDEEGGRRPRRDDRDHAVVAWVDAWDDRLCTPPSIEEEEVVPTSASQERYLSLSQAPIGSLDVQCASVDDDHVDKAVNVSMSPISNAISSEGSTPPSGLGLSNRRRRRCLR
ncbi:hypothetical protein F5148DRAFT_551356 [Russula earlei]|uniref:Uncharacterized protein n=1 Tax=Russula earlei TaxID=71964 RepID=A0ACC0TWA8_9AGAM|nr:hypothetical protein F5148DRAFT_551356 [Russula earlei]